jgi:hypothetical protein
LESAILGGIVSLIYVEEPLEGFSRPLTEALDNVFEDAAVNGMLLLCSHEGCSFCGQSLRRFLIIGGLDMERR